MFPCVLRLVLLIAILWRPLPADEAQEKCAQWIAKLGSKEFSEREAASQELLKLGVQQLQQPALKDRGVAALGEFHRNIALPLDRAVKSDDSEIAFRARQIHSKLLPGRPLSEGVAGWALYAAWNDLERLPAAIPSNDLDDLAKGLKEWERDRLKSINDCRGEPRVHLVQVMVRHVAEQDPRAAAEWIATKSYPGRYWGSDLALAMHVWATKDFDRALAWANAWPDKSYQKVAQRALLKDWPLDRPVAEALKMLEECYPDSSDTSALDAACRVANAYARQNADAAWKWVQRKPWRRIEGNLYREVMLALAETDLEKALAIHGALPEDADGDFGRVVLVAALQKLGKPVEEKLIESIKSPERRKWAHYEVLKRMLAQERLDDAIAYFDAKLEDQVVRMNAVARICEHIAKTDPPRAVEWLSKRDESERSLAPFYLASAWARRDAAAAADFAKKVAHPHQRCSAVARVADIWAETDPVAAMKLIDETDWDSYRSMILARNQVLDHWAKQDGQAAATWLLEQTDEGIQLRGIEVVAKAWAKHDPARACQWVLSLDNVELRVHALLGIADGLVEGAEVVRVTHTGVH